MTKVILNREDGSVDFDREWNDYKKGFGNVGGEFWLGLDNIHQLTSTANYGLLVEIEDWSGNQFWAWYYHFSVESEAQLYRLSVSGYDVTSTAGDAFTDAQLPNDIIDEWILQQKILITMRTVVRTALLYGKEVGGIMLAM